MGIVDWLHKYEAYVPVFLRFGLGVIFFWFGIDKFLHPLLWRGFIPPFVEALLPISVGLFESIQGVIEIIVGVLLIIGLWRQFAAAVAGLILIPIIIVTFAIGAYDIALRDVGLLAVSISLTVVPETIFSVDKWRKLKKLRK